MCSELEKMHDKKSIDKTQCKDEYQEKKIDNVLKKITEYKDKNNETWTIQLNSLCMINNATQEKKALRRRPIFIDSINAPKNKSR